MVNKLSFDSESVTRSAAAVEAAVAKFANVLGDQCAKRTVCEAHARANKNNFDGEGADLYRELVDSPLSMPIRAMFPVPDLTDLENEYLEDVTLSPFQVAALYGRTKGADCGEQYKLCFVSLLDLSSSTSTKVLAHLFKLWQKPL